ncbi:MAG: hypothetical protein AAF586_03145 [Planctomycetota bacterium]
MAPSAPDSKPFPLIKSIVVLVAAVGGLAALSIVTMRSVGIDLALSIECAIAAAACGAAGVVALFAAWLGQRQMGMQGVIFGFLAGTTLRLLLSGAVAVAAFMAFEKQRVLLWFGLWYLVVLVIEVNAVTSYLITSALSDSRDSEKDKEGTEPDADPDAPPPDRGEA